VAAIAGGAVGGIAFIVLVIVCAFIFVRRRSPRARHISGGEDGLNGGANPLRPEEDMPPPDYQGVFPQADMTSLSRIGAAWPRLSTTGTRFNSAARPMHNMTLTPATGAGQADDVRLWQRSANDASLLTWEGRQPEAVAGAKKSAGDLLPARAGLEDELGRPDENRLKQRNANDASVLTWKGRHPEVVVAGGMKLAGDSLPSRADLEDEPRKANDDRVGQRNANDASILAWKGCQPEAVAAGNKLEGDPIPIHLDYDLEDEPRKA
jgi:hypothetical protein